ncbi:MAG TPA: TetR/AcrR family transcriptional regulator [Miltoncostaeales bacterium]|nr:TetR/AcrR family transcriptional regulator [Miltoncostaeales bacterium]
MTQPHQTTTPPPSPGRALRTTDAILAAAREILAEGGVRGLTVEGVAARSGVAKTSIYRRFAGKHEIALAILLEIVPTVGQPRDRGDTRRELVDYIERTIRAFRDTAMGAVLKGLVSDLATDLQLSGAFRVQVIAQRMAATQAILERGIARGEIRPDVNMELAHELLVSPIFYRMFLSGEPLRTVFATQIVDSILPGLRPPA